jgi:hypothetical protein
MGLARASWSAYSIMKGVMTPAVSAGSNHDGASETWTARMICPSGAASAGESPVDGCAATRAVTRVRESRKRARFTMSSGVSRWLPAGPSECLAGREYTTRPGWL